MWKPFSLLLIVFSIIIQNSLSAEVYNSDPETSEYGETYIELQGLFQAYVLHQAALPGKRQCTPNCADIPKTVGHAKCIDKTLRQPAWGGLMEKFIPVKYCANHYCNGPIYNCAWIGGDVDLCQAPDDSLKRYEYVRSYGNDKFYGEWTECQGGTYSAMTGAGSDKIRCDICLCECAEDNPESPAVRAFSFRPQISNIGENKVVSDLRFVLKNKMIHIQIEESPLIEGGQVDKNQANWVDLENFDYSTDSGTFAKSDDDGETLTRDVDFAFLSSHQRNLNLDEIIADKNYVITGVRMNHEIPTGEATETSSEESSEQSAPTYTVGEENLSAIQLEIYVTRYDPDNNKLSPTDDDPSKWIAPSAQSDPNIAYNTTRMEVEVAFAVTTSQAPFTTAEPAPNRYIRFESSSIHSDAGQSTVPFIDAQSAAPGNYLPLTGAGLMYRGSADYAGYVALKVITYEASE